MRELEIILVRHAEPIAVGTPGIAEDDRPLTPAGRLAALEIAERLAAEGPTAILSSPYRRAVETVEPLAERCGLRLSIVDDLRERRLSLTLHDGWRESLVRSWSDPDFSLPGAESGRAAQTRVRRYIETVRERNPEGGRIVMGSHGNLIALLLSGFDPAIGVDWHLAMPMPAIYRLSHDGQGWRIDS